MAVDESLMAAARRGRVTFRLYGWNPGCLSFGRNQTARGRYDGERALRRGFDVVRRPTGGRSVFHHREITYSVTAPAEAWGGLGDAYLKINRALAAGLRELGAPADVVSQKAGAGSPRPTVRACFRDPLPGEVVAGGRKLIGSAQWRDGEALLQHGSLLLHNDQSIVEELRIGGPGSVEVPASGLADLLDPLPGPADIADALIGAFARELEMEATREDLSPDEAQNARAIQDKYSDDTWTWRR
jgi:lipoate-protein ligase A